MPGPVQVAGDGSFPDLRSGLAIRPGGRSHPASPSGTLSSRLRRQRVGHGSPTRMRDGHDAGGARAPTHQAGRLSRSPWQSTKNRARPSAFRIMHGPVPTIPLPGQTPHRQGGRTGMEGAAGPRGVRRAVPPEGPGVRGRRWSGTSPADPASGDIRAAPEGAGPIVPGRGGIGSMTYAPQGQQGPEPRGGISGPFGGPRPGSPVFLAGKP